MEKETTGGKSSLLAYLLELATMASVCDENSVAKDFYISAYKVVALLLSQNGIIKGQWNYPLSFVFCMKKAHRRSNTLLDYFNAFYTEQVVLSM